MAHLALTIDPDPLRRASFLAAARQKLDMLGGLSVSQVQCGELAAVWGSFSGAPQSHRATATSFALVLGDAIQDNGGRLHESTIEGRETLDDGTLPNCDGFYLAVSSVRHVGLVLGVDLLGMFPLYYRARPDSLVAATSCELCLAHPHVQRDLNPSGLTGILLTNGLVLTAGPPERL